MIYQHEAQGADRAVTDAIDTHIQAERHDDDGSSHYQLRKVSAVSHR